MAMLVTPIWLWAKNARLVALIITISQFCTLPNIGVAGDSPSNLTVASRLDLKTERVVVFKDGYCLVVKQGKATTDADGVAYTDDVPDAAVLGSFWAVPEKGTIQSLVAGWVDTESTMARELNCTNIMEVVKSNLGKACSLEVDQERIEGRLLKILSNDELANNLSAANFNDPSDSMRLSSQLSASQSTRSLGSRTATTSISDVGGEYFLLRTQSGDMMIRADMVRNLTIENMNSLIEKTMITKSRHKRLTMKFAQANAEVNVNLMYFRPDVRWIPTYRINLTGQALAPGKDPSPEKQASQQQKAEMIMQGEILNEAEDFTNVPFHVVVGVPNFRFRTIPSPIVLEATLRNSLAQAAPSIMGRGNHLMSNAVFTQQISDFRSRPATQDETTAIDLPDELNGKGGNDMFVYQLAPMTLRRGERAIVPILHTDIAYRDIYTWDIQMTHSENFVASTVDSPSPLRLSEARVWRQVELVNNSNVPWTTGAAMIVDEMQPLAQELLTYTSPGSSCRVPVTVSVDLRGKAEDTETGRELKVLSWRGHDYARVTGKIEAELTNQKKEPVTLAVQLRFGGKATKLSDNGKVVLEAYHAEDWHEQRGDPINNSSVIRWTETILPGESFKPTVDYEYYLRY
ncbi:hypothetical protein Q31b_12460 [Novipirellula aureliae]|uniref:DUF4139 domain-containing protein n=1 Tax=Novipirellula aureliae TaxID=2527966 RepID=A0A5C6E711_9BACT|nr:hypothetical protein Q31b_12460 [Novipirellula aureliae]